MQYRSLGSTGIKVSEIGMGGEHLDPKPYELVILNLFMPGNTIRANIAFTAPLELT